jgi:IPT/TIG domain
MRRLVFCCLALVALTAPVAAASAAPRPVITSFSPDQVKVGQTLVLTGKHFRKGARKNRVYFSRASDMKTVLARPTKATSSRIVVVVPSTVENFLNTDAAGNKVPTRFRLRVIARAFGKYTPASNSPLILSASGPKPAAPAPPPAPPSDCDQDGVADTADGDDDNDLLSDDTERAIGTNSCNRDTDGDGVDDAFEYYSALDLNGNALPYPGKRPYPNPLDASDAEIDYDRDGLKSSQEFQAWASFGSHVLPLNYSDGDQTTGTVSGPVPGLEYMDLDNDGVITDDEKDVDSDGLPNYVEIAPNAESDIWTDFGGGVKRPTGNTFAAGRLSDQFAYLFVLDYLSNDSDGDTVTDGADDQDHDGLSNVEEITPGTDTLYSDPLNPCAPSASAFCPQHPKSP